MKEFQEKFKNLNIKMATVKRFEELLCWQKSRMLVAEVYRSFSKCNDWGFKDQIQRAAVSVMSNIAEGFERGTRQEFINYLFIAKGSAGEVRAQLYAASSSHACRLVNVYVPHCLYFERSLNLQTVWN